jgi:hypothetical protein
MAVSQSFRIQRVTLVAGVLTPIYPTVASCSVAIGNGTGADLELHTNTDESEKSILAASYERPVTLHTHRFAPAEIAFWLKSAAGGTVVILWL